MPVLRVLREKVGLTQVQLAKQIPKKGGHGNLSQSAISNWETGQDEPELTVAQMKALCAALRVSLDELPDYFGPPLRSQPSDPPGNQEE